MRWTSRSNRTRAQCRSQRRPTLRRGLADSRARNPCPPAMGAPLVEGQMMHEERFYRVESRSTRIHRRDCDINHSYVNAEMQHEVVKRTPRTLRDRPEGPMTKDTKKRGTDWNLKSMSASSGVSDRAEERRLQKIDVNWMVKKPSSQTSRTP